MNNRPQIILGSVIILIGLFSLAGYFFDFNVWAIFWPMLLILVGLWLVLRPRMAGPDTAVTQKLLGEIQRSGTWAVTNEEFNLLVGDVNLDFRNAHIPLGETTLRFAGFVGDITLQMPEDVGIRVSSSAFLSEVKMQGDKQESFLSAVRVKSSNYDTADRQINLQTSAFVAEVNVI